jgi:Flp pilus assembly protein TadG
MRSIKKERGSVVVFVTLIIVLLLIIVGMGLDTGQLTYSRSQGQAAVDAAALSAASGLPVGAAQVNGRASAFNFTNNYIESPTNAIGSANITYLQYDSSSGGITPLPDITNANGVRVALEQKNPYTNATTNAGITSPLFLTPLLNLFGQIAPATTDINVSAVAVLTAKPGIPIAIMDSLCNGSATVPNVNLLQTDANIDNSCWTTYWDNPVNVPKVRALFDASASCTGLADGGTQLAAEGADIYLENGLAATLYDDAENLFIKSQKGKCWIVPVVPASTKCNQTNLIVDWATICPTVVHKNPEPHFITADVTCKQSLYRAKDNLCFAPKLVRDIKSGM